MSVNVMVGTQYLHRKWSEKLFYKLICIRFLHASEYFQDYASMYVHAAILYKNKNKYKYSLFNVVVNEQNSVKSFRLLVFIPTWN